MLKVVITHKEGSVKKDIDTVYFKRRWTAKLFQIIILASFRKRYKKQGIELGAWIQELELKDHLILSNGK